MNMLGNKQNKVLENAFIDKISKNSLKNLITSILNQRKIIYTTEFVFSTIMHSYYISSIHFKMQHTHIFLSFL